MTEAREIQIPFADGGRLPGSLVLPEADAPVVIFAHGSGSSRNSPRNLAVAAFLNEAGLGTLLFDLLQAREAADRRNVFDVPRLASRLAAATRWLRAREPRRPLGYFGASTGAGAALWAAADLEGGNARVEAIVSRGGRPDLARPRLHEVTAPTLLLVGGADQPVIGLNEQACRALRNARLVVVPGASHLFEEPGTLERVAHEARDWFLRHLGTARSSGKDNRYLRGA